MKKKTLKRKLYTRTKIGSNRSKGKKKTIEMKYFKIGESTFYTVKERIQRRRKENPV